LGGFGKKTVQPGKTGWFVPGKGKRNKAEKQKNQEKKEVRARARKLKKKGTREFCHLRKKKWGVLVKSTEEGNLGSQLLRKDFWDPIVWGGAAQFRGKKKRKAGTGFPKMVGKTPP